MVVPDFFGGDPYVLENAERSLPVWLKDHGTVNYQLNKHPCLLLLILTNIFIYEACCAIIYFIARNYEHFLEFLAAFPFYNKGQI